MKRTRETINYAHPSERWNLSGCLDFDGRDENEEARRKQKQREQKEALEQQMLENKRNKDLERQHDM